MQQTVNKSHNFILMPRRLLSSFILPLVYFLSLATAPGICFAEYFVASSSYDVCFTPGGDCVEKITQEIVLAKKEILVQAYNFTDITIANALVTAKNKGVKISIILDKSQLKTRHTLVPYFIKHKIFPVIDSAPAIAHNKVIIIDDHTVIGGSYNLSKAAATKNAENVTIIRDASFTKAYREYWQLRRNKSKSLSIATRGENRHASR